MKATRSYTCEQCKYSCTVYQYFDTKNRDDVSPKPVHCPSHHDWDPDWRSTL